MVHVKFTLPVLAALAFKALADQAPQVNDNPTNVVAVADFPQGGKHKEILGTMKFFSTNGTVKVHWDVTKLPKRKGPFYYHIHEHPVGRKGNCENAGLHFNPYNAPANCEKFDNDSFCQVGDLSGKHGWIDTTCFESSYYDPYISLKPDNPAYIVGKSVVIHYPNLKKIACADIVISSESVKHADRESKRNIKHNKDLVEASLPDYQPVDEEEAKMIEDAHREWLELHSNSENNHDDDSGEADAENDDDESASSEEENNTASASSVNEASEAQEDKREAATESSNDSQEQKEVSLKDLVEKEGYEQVMPEEETEKDTENDTEKEIETTLKTTECENNANNEMVANFGLLLSVLAGYLGFMI